MDIDRARRYRGLKHGGDRRRVPIPEQVEAIAPDDDVLLLDEALGRLEELDARKATVVKLRYFAGLKVEECAAALGVSPRTVNGDWRFAKAWLHREISGEADGGS